MEVLTGFLFGFFPQTWNLPKIGIIHKKWSWEIQEDQIKTPNEKNWFIP
jgi:hypothetical protein